MAPKRQREPREIARQIVAGEYRVDDGPRLMTLGDQERMSAEFVRLEEQNESLRRVADAAVAMLSARKKRARLVYDEEHALEEALAGCYPASEPEAS